ncbi:hypothetical protein V6O07_16155, partial [Arthrospira platensis SPKY2]
MSPADGLSQGKQAAALSGKANSTVRSQTGGYDTTPAHLNARIADVTARLEPRLNQIDPLWLLRERFA